MGSDQGYCYSYHKPFTLFAQVKRFLADAGAEAHPYTLKLCNCDWQTIILNFIAMFVNFVFKFRFLFWARAQ